MFTDNQFAEVLNLSQIYRGLIRVVQVRLLSLAILQKFSLATDQIEYVTEQFSTLFSTCLNLTLLVLIIPL